MRRRIGRPALVGWLLLIALTATAESQGAAPTQDSGQTHKPAQILGVRVGFAGRYKVGLWTPVEVRCSGVSRVRAAVADSDGVLSRVTGDVRGDSALLYVRFGRAESRLIVELPDADVRRVFTSRASTGDPSANDQEVDTSYPPALAATRQLIVAISAEPMGVQQAVGLLREDDDSRSVAVRLPDCRQLPDRWYGYEGVNTVVVSTSRPELFAGLEPDGPQLRALDRWIRMGGKLILCVGAEAEAVIAPGRPLSRFVPGRLQTMVSLRPRELGALEAFAESSLPIPQPAGGGGPTLRAPRLAEGDGSVVVREADLPLVVRAPWGMGQVVFLAADLDREPLAKWTDRPLLLTRLLDPPTPRSEELQDNAAMMHYGFNDMAGQLRSALDRFEGVRRVPFWAVALLAVFYILAIGPGDYFLLRRVIGRMRLTWVTFPAIALLFGAAVCFTAFWLKGDRVAVNQVDVVDVDLATGFVRQTTWANVFSPRAEPFDLTLRPNLAPVAKTASGNDSASGGKAPSPPAPLPRAGEGSHAPQTSPPAVLPRAGEGSDAPQTSPPAVLPRAGEGSHAPQTSPPAVFPRAGEGSDVPEADLLFGWLGLPGEALGGMNPRAVNPVESIETYDYSPRLDAVERVPIRAWSSRSFTARCGAVVDPRLRCELVQGNRSLSGTITNTLDFPLSNCLVAYNRWVYQFDTIEPGETIELGPMARRSELRTLLNGRRIVSDDRKQSTHLEATPYERSSTDLAYILRTMTFFEDAGGRRYTGLFNGYQGFVDLSGLLRAGRAVLFAQAPDEGAPAEKLPSDHAGAGRHGAELVVESPATLHRGETHATFYRFVLPVKSEPDHS